MRLHLLKTGLFLSAFSLPAAGIAQGDSLSPYMYPDDAFVSVAGEVAAVGADTFTLDFGDGDITIEMDDGDRDADAYRLLEGDRVTVYGRMDDDFFETATIEASSVYVDKLDTFFYASSIDEEDYDFVSVALADDPPEITVQGLVTDVSREDGEFSISTGEREFDVVVDELASDPLDEVGYQRLEAGDVVSVQGDLDYGFFEGRQLIAKTITKILDHDS